ncbi:hypothetical protein BOX15_Mlig034517g2, partial [Macrostomum lignano]
LLAMSSTSGDSSAIPAPVKWAQRNDKLYLTICLEDVQNKQLDLTSNRLTFTGVGGTDRKPHSTVIDFYAEVNPDESLQMANDREIVMSIRKKEPGPYWPRLTADKVKRHWIKTDFNRWVDEDEGPGGDEDGGGFGANDNQLESMLAQMGGGFGGAGGGAGGMDFLKGDEEDFDLGDGEGLEADGPDGNGKKDGEDEEIPPLE